LHFILQRLFESARRKIRWVLQEHWDETYSFPALQTFCPNGHKHSTNRDKSLVGLNINFWRSSVPFSRINELNLRIYVWDVPETRLKTYSFLHCRFFFCKTLGPLTVSQSYKTADYIKTGHAQYLCHSNTFAKWCTLSSRRPTWLVWNYVTLTIEQFKTVVLPHC
jgi:hypothetical protein